MTFTIEQLKSPKMDPREPPPSIDDHKRCYYTGNQKRQPQ